MSFSPYVVMRHGVRWNFPLAANRLAYVATVAEQLGIAYQASDDTFWYLKSAPNTWIQISMVGGLSAPTSGTTGAVTADWSNKPTLTQAQLTGAVVYTFTPPAKANQNVILLGASDGATSAATGITWPASVIWYGSTFATTVANKKWFAKFFYDGTNYHSVTAGSQV